MTDKRIEPSGKPVDGIHHDPTGLVENMYRPNWMTTGPFDSTSHFRMETYLHERHQPQAVELEPGSTINVVHTSVNYRPSIFRWERTGWHIPPLAAGIFTLGALASANAFYNGGNLLKSLAGDIGDEAAQIIHNAEELFFPLPPKIVTRNGGTIDTITVETSPQASTQSGQDLVQVDPADISRFLGEVNAATNAGGAVTTVEITGNASDEAGSDSSIGQIDAYNTDLETRRADAAKTELLRQAAEQGISLPEINMSIHEDVLTPAEKAHLTELAQAAGYSTGYAAVQAQANGQKLDGALGEFIEDNFATTRNYTLTATITQTTPGESHQIQGEVPQYRPTPENPIRDYPFNFISVVVPFIPILRRKLVPVVQTETIPYETDPRLTATFKVYPEGIEKALDEHGVEQYYLTEDNPWQWTRKFQHLLRDDRIHQELRADYKDMDGKEQAFRVFFVDQTPTDETIAMFKDLLEQASLMQNGSLAKKLSAIFVYLTESTGKHSDDPKRIGLGIDTQRNTDVLGTTMPILKLIEMHMSQSLTTEELAEIRDTLGHELGHKTDVTDRRIELNPVSGQEVPSTNIARFASGEPMRGIGAEVIADLQSLADPSRSLFFETENGTILHESETANLGRASLTGNVRLINGRPTIYGDNQVEGYADAVRSLLTGPIPFIEAGINADGGYRIAENLEQVVQDNLGADRVPHTLEYGNLRPDITFTQGTVEQDKALREVIDAAKRRAVPDPKDLAEIITSVTD
jgi:hypothetical protein